MTYYYETIRQPARHNKHSVHNPGIWHVYDRRRGEQAIAVCYDRMDAEAIVRTLNLALQLPAPLRTTALFPRDTATVCDLQETATGLGIPLA